MVLRCVECGTTYEESFRLKCNCGGPLEVVNDFSGSFESLLNSSKLDNTRYSEFVSISNRFDPDLRLSITPTVEKIIDGIHVDFKLDYTMPTGSFKDRGTYVTTAKFNEVGIKEVSLDSSGNAAISLAIFGSSENIKTHIFISSDISEGKKRILDRFASEVHEVSGDRMEVHERAENFDGAEYVSHWLNPYFIEGTKLAAYEIVEKSVPDVALVPTGSGTLFLGLYKGFKELKELGRLEEIPKIISVEGMGYESLMDRSEEVSELAEGIEITDPPRIRQMKEVLDRSNGYSISVTDDEIRAALRELESMGFVVESTSAVAFAAFKELKRSNRIVGGDRVLIPLTGTGLKLF